jgi:hypothetical protein
LLATGFYDRVHGLTPVSQKRTLEFK